MSNIQRKNSMDMKDHEGLLHKYARGGHARLTSAGVGIDYDDVLQEIRISFIKASRKFNPEIGVGFSSYMGRAVINNFNLYAERELSRHFGLGVISIEELSGSDDDETSCDLWGRHDFASSDDIEETIAHRSEMKFRIGLLSRRARKVIRELVNPSHDILAHHQRQRQEMLEAKAKGEPCGNVPDQLTIRYIARFHKFKYPEIIEEINRTLGLDL